jgi:AraC-like DNA-binding protein
MLEAAWRDVASPGAHEGFADFVRGLLTSSAFEGPALGALLRWFKTLATVMAGAGTVRSLERDALDHARAVRQLVPELHMWPTAAGLVDRYENAQWAASYRKNDLTSEGLHEFPTHVIVALPAEQERSSTDIVEHMLCIDALQRTSAALALSLRNTVAGRLGEQGAFILTHLPAASEERTKARLVTLVEKFALFARRKVGLRIACGVSQRALVGTELPERHREALWAAQWGVHRGELATFYRQDKRGPAALPEHGLYAAQRALRAAFAAGDRLATGAAGEGVIQEVLWASGGSIEAIRSHLIALLFELLALIERRGEMEPRVLEETMTHSTRSLLDARTASELTTTFARLVRELQAGPSRRSVLSLRAKLEQARRIIERGYREPMDRASIARTVGISPAHLSREFKATFGMGLREMLVHRRIDGAQRLLRMTTLNVKQVAQETGFSSAAYFVHSFRRATGMTPEQYRRTGMVRR